MHPINNIDQRATLSETQRLDINPNAAPGYIPHEETIQPEQLKNIKNDFSDAKNAALLKLRAMPGFETPKPVSPYYVQNPGEDTETQETENSEGDYEQIYAPLDAGNGDDVNDDQKVNGNNDDIAVETGQQALESAEVLLEEAESISNELKEGDWEIEDESTGYKYIDPEFYVLYEQLMSVLNVLQLLGVIIDSIYSMKTQMIKRLSPQSEKNNIDSNVSEVLGLARENGTLMGQSQLMEMSEDVYTWNQSLLQDKMNAAKKKAQSDARNSVGNWFSEIGTSGTSDAFDRDSNAMYAEKAYYILSDYDAFNAKAQSHYERVLGKAKLYEDGLSEVGNIFGLLSKDNLVVDIDSQKVDIDRTKIMGYQMRVASLENGRRLASMYRAALSDLKSLVVEILTGENHTPKVKETLIQLLDTLEKFENMIFSSMAQQLQTTIYAHNTKIDAWFEAQRAQTLRHSSYGASWFGPLCGIVKNITDWGCLESLYSDIGTNSTSPKELDMNQLNSLIYQIYGDAGKQIQEDISRGAKYAAELRNYEKREWQIIGQLSNENVVYTGNDGYQGLNEAKVNALREQLMRIQNKERILITVVDGLYRLIKAILKIQLEIGEVDSEKGLSASFGLGIESRNLFFDMKLSGIKNKMEAFNSAKKIAQEREKMRAVGIGSIFGLAVAVILIVIAAFTGGATVPLVIGLISGMSQLGAAIGNIIYNAMHPIDAKLHEQTAFYDSIQDSQDRQDKLFNEQIDRINENSHITSEDNKDPMSSGTMWAPDTALLMDVRNRLVRIYLSEQIATMYVKALCDMKSIVVSGTTGVWAGSDFDAVQDASSARFETKTKAFDLKEDMIKDIISRHNLEVQQDTDQNWAILQACISAVSVACAGAGAVGGLSEGLQAGVEWTSFGAELASLGAQATQSYFEADAGYGELGDFKKIQDMIDLLMENSFFQQGNDTLRQAFMAVGADSMLESVAGGKVVVDSTSYYQSLRQMQQLYNRVILTMKVSEAIARIKAKIARAPAPYGTSQAYEAAKANYTKQLDLLKDHVDAYAERYNQIVDSWRQFTVAVVMMAVTVLLKVMNETKADKKVKTWLHDKSYGDKASGAVADNPGKGFAKFMADFYTNSDSAWDGTLGTGDFAVFAYNMVMNPATFKFFTQMIFDEVYGGNRKADKVDASLATRSTSNSTVDRLDRQAYQNQLRTAALQNNFSQMDIDWQLNNEFYQYMDTTMDTAAKSVVDDSFKDVVQGLVRVGEKIEVKDGVTYLPASLNTQLRVINESQLQEIDWNNAEDAKIKLQAAAQKVKTYDNEGKLLDPNEVSAAIGLLAIATVDELSPQDQAKAIPVLEAIVSDPSADPVTRQLAMAAIGANLQKDPTNPACMAAAQSAVYAVWNKSPEKAEQICSNVRTNPLLMETYDLAHATAAMLVDPTKAQTEDVDASVAPDLLASRKKILHLKARAKAIEWAAEKGKDVAPQVEEYKKELYQFVQMQDCVKCKIDLLDIKTRIEAAKTPEELAIITDELVNNVDLMKELGPVSEKYCREIVETLKTAQALMDKNKSKEKESAIIEHQDLKDFSRRVSVYLNQRKEDQQVRDNEQLAKVFNNKSDGMLEVAVTGVDDRGDQGYQGGRRDQRQQMAWANGLSKNAELIKKHNGNGNGGLA